MKYEVYTDIKVTDDYEVFEFMSIGKKGVIPKRIEFTSTDLHNVVNLAFGDINDEGEIDDYSISDNGDRNKVLATVAYIVEIYLDRHSGRFVYFRESTQERTRLCRMAVGLNFNELAQRFDIFAESADTIVPFERNIEITGLFVRETYV